MHPVSLPLVSMLLLAPLADGWLGIYLDTDREEPVVTEVIPGSPAAEAGLQAGDQILAIDDHLTPTREALIEVVRARSAGDRVKIKVRRGDKEPVVTVKLGEHPETRPQPLTPAQPAPSQPAPSQRRRAAPPPQPSAEVEPVAPAPAEQRAYLGLRLRDSDRGIVIDEVLPDGPAHAAGVRTGERITSIGEQQVKSGSDLDRALAGHKPGGQVTLGLQSDQGVRSLTVTLGQRPLAPATRGGDLPAISNIEPAKPKPGAAPAEQFDLEAEVRALRKELRDLRRQFEELRRQRDGE